ncbi:MAG TPA: T9SS type A sorting domain-containing protein, partial [Bacteroidetes bacterium]|nr:T9SS type A sorting domain-containing protein [Bacteroidota bacterium]
EPGLEAINAPALWAMGYTGYGQLALPSDTGIDPSHPALAHQYRGHYVAQQQTWYEVNGAGNPTGNFTPVWCGDHGTHVTGTILGLDRMRNDTIGVAFNAQWIGAMTLCGIGTADNIGAFEWALNPDGDSTTTDDMPAVINNSWWDPSLGGNDCFSVYRSIMEALETAGIAVVFSAGNNGPDMGTITPPKNININEVNIFSVASLNANSSFLTIANSSSRGPSQCMSADSSLLIKPEVAAPGVSVRSAVPGADYDFKSGTSMAAPHVSGALLLLKEAFPDLPGKDLKLALYHSCTDLGTPGEDNTYGMGIINVLEAFNYLVSLGHEPASPHRANDVRLVDVSNPVFYCSNEVNPTIIVENSGTDTLLSFVVFYKAGPVLGEFEWNGILPPAQRTQIALPPVTVGSGQTELSLSVEQPNGLQDERPLNNRFSTMIVVSDRPRFEAVVEGPGSSVCTNTPALLRGILPDYLQNTGATMDINWYDAPIGGTLLGNGEVWSTPDIAHQETFYAEVTYTIPAGPKDLSIGPEAQLDTTDLGLVFDVFTDLTLKTVHAFKDDGGGVIVRLLDANGETLRQKITLSPPPGKVEIGLDWDLTPGTYQLVVGGGKPLMYNTSGASFPYIVADVLSITGTTDGSGNEGVYYFFYDWQVAYQEPCGRSPVEVVAGPDGNAPVTDFSLSADTVNVADNEVVQFNSQTTGAVEWHWNFGNGQLSTEENPEHLFTAPGHYLISLIATDSNGCTGHAFHPLVVIEENVLNVPPIQSLPQVLVYPNPAHDRLYILHNLPALKKIPLRLTDATGHIRKITQHPTDNNLVEMKLHGLPPGVYYLLIETDKERSVWKVVKL